MLSYLGKTEDRLPWSQWLKVAGLPPVVEDEREDYEEAKAIQQAGLRMFELLRAPTEEVLEGLLVQRGLLSGVERHCLRDRWSIRKAQCSALLAGTTWYYFQPLVLPSNKDLRPRMQ